MSDILSNILYGNWGSGLGEGIYFSNHGTTRGADLGGLFPAFLAAYHSGQLPLDLSYIGDQLSQTIDDMGGTEVWYDRIRSEVLRSKGYSQEATDAVIDFSREKGWSDEDWGYFINTSDQSIDSDQDPFDRAYGIIAGMYPDDDNIEDEWNATYGSGGRAENPPETPEDIDEEAEDQGGDPVPGSGTGGGQSGGGGTVGGGTTTPPPSGGAGSTGGNGDSGWDWDVIFGPGFPGDGEGNMDDIFGDIWDWVTGTEGNNNLWSNISDLIGDITQTVDIDFGNLGSLLGSGWESLAGLFEGAWSSLEDMFSGGLDAMTQSSLGQALGSIGAALIQDRGIQRQLDIQEEYQQMAMDRADPFFQHRAQYGDKMNQLMNNPLDTTMLDPSYQWRYNQGLEAMMRAGAAGGKLGSGNILTAAQEYGQGMASQEFQNIFNRYGALSGATNANLGQSSLAASYAGDTLASGTGSRYQSGLDRLASWGIY